MTTYAAEASRTTDALSISDFTIQADQVVMFRVRQRLASHGLTLDLRAEKDGWRWAVSGQPPLTPHIFGSLHLALYHADAHTAVQYKDSPPRAYA